ncbi:MAG: DUF6596 domain-containing protein [Polaromonas sp.]
MSVLPVHAAAELAARQSYGRLLAILSARTRDIAASEDALADAFASALESWPRDGVPANPPAWLLTVARRNILDQWRRSKVREDAAQTLVLLADEFADTPEGGAVMDERMRLMFVCAHPAIDAAARAPLMLQTVLGLDVARMAGPFLTSPATLGQRLVRAKTRIRVAGIAFTNPLADELPRRLHDVQDGIYAAYGAGWEDVEGADSGRHGLTAEAIAMGRILCEQMPHEPEPAGLLALMLFCESRADARRNSHGDYVPLDRQDTGAWNHVMLDEAELRMLKASSMGRLGPFQLEAAIQSAHTQRRLGRDVPPAALVALYDGLLAFTPTLGAQVSRACALANEEDPRSGLRALAALQQQDPGGTARYQPWWAAQAHLLARAGCTAEAREAYQKAIGMASHAAVKAYLTTMAEALSTAQ